MNAPWQPHFLGPSALFDPLRPAGELLQALPDWPALEVLNRLIADRTPVITNRNGQPIRFVAQDMHQVAFESRYEPRIYLRGEVQTRARNWHDLFNALVWLTFPRTKAMLNAKQYQEFLVLQRSVQHNRTRAQDALTIFDEGGAILVSRDPDLVKLVHRFAWKELFWSQRVNVEHDLRCFLFGHALYEKALAPYKGMTAKCLLMNVPTDFFALPFAEQLEQVDAYAAARFNVPPAQLRTDRLAPLPVLGLPGWATENADPRYYDDKAYFRDGYQRSPHT